MDISNEILEYGSDIINSDEFKYCLNTSHHFNTTIGKHMLNVAYKSLELASFLENNGIFVDKSCLVKAALCHDFAMAHAKEFYGFSGYFTTAFRHPIDSYKIAQNICTIDKKTRKIISRHMWPLCIIPPSSLEGWIITISDKYVAFCEIFNIKLICKMEF